MKKQLTQKEQLQKQLNDIAIQEKKDMVELHYPIFKKLEGRMFKSKNSYGGSSKPWYLYQKVVSITPDMVYDTNGNGIACHFKGYYFQVTSRGIVSVTTNDSGYVHSLGKEITETEFNEAWNKLTETLNNLP